MEKETAFEVKKEAGQVWLKITNKDINPHPILESLRDKGATVSLEQVENVLSSPTGKWVSISGAERKEIEISISPDRMRADIRLNISADKSLPAGEEIRKILKEQGVTFGIQEDKIEALLRQGPSIPGKWLEIARGKPPRDGVDASFKVLVDTDRKGPLHSADEAQVDLKDLGMINNVEEDQLIVTKTPLEREEDGMSVTGEVLKAKKARDLTLRAGPNTRLTENGLELIATAGGHLLRKGNIFSVEKVFQVHGDVDYSTGNLESSGSIGITGSVKDDFSVNAAENLEVRGVVEGAYLSSGMDMILRSSVRGMGKGIIRCGNDLHAEYMDQCRIRTGGDLLFKKALMHCDVETEGAIRIIPGGKGVIAGGTLRAGTEIECTTLGTRMGTKTHLQVGVSPRLMDQKKDLQEKIMELKGKERALEKNILYLSKTLSEKGLTPEQKALAAKYLELRPVLQDQIKRMKDLQLEIDEAIDRAKLRGCIKVRGCCYPGVSISIRKDTFLVRDTLQEVCFLYRDGRIVPLSLEE